MCARIEKPLRRLVVDETAQTLFEYAWLAALIVIVCLVGIGLMGRSVNNAWSSVTNQLP